MYLNKWIKHDLIEHYIILSTEILGAFLDGLLGYTCEG